MYVSHVSSKRETLPLYIVRVKVSCKEVWKKRTVEDVYNPLGYGGLYQLSSRPNVLLW